MNRRTSFIFATLLLTTLSVSAIDLDAGFRNPQKTTKPYCFWYWLNADITADGITKDLESMAKVVGTIYLSPCTDDQRTAGTVAMDLTTTSPSAADSSASQTVNWVMSP